MLGEKVMLSISAIVPTCNRPAMLERALRSIAAQTIAPVEVIVADDSDRGENDATRKVVEQCGLGNMVLVTNSRSKGASGTRNSGADVATGELLAFLDDDDEWLPSYLFEASRRFETKDLDVICTDLLCRFDDGIDRPGKAAPDGVFVDLFLTRNPGLIGSNLIVRRSLYREVGGFDESLRTCEDRDFGLRLSLREEVRYERLPARLVRLNTHTASKLCTRAGDAMKVGVSRFWDLHSHRMTAAQQEEFRNNVGLFWGIDESGQKIDRPSTSLFNSLLPTLKAKLDNQRKRSGLD
jgi:glycosyltransferase involved in cell wall biosynthesis